MTYHRYEVSGISCEYENKFEAECISKDIILAIQLFRLEGYSVHKIERKEQVSNTDKDKIIFIKKGKV